MPPVPGPDATSGASGSTGATGSSKGGQPAAKAKSPGPASQATTEQPVVPPAGAGKPAGAPRTEQVKAGPAQAQKPAAAARATPEAAAAASSGRPAADEAPATPPRESKVPRAASEKAAPASATQMKDVSGPRRVRLAVSRLDPWSVMKLSFLLSIAIGIMIVVASVVFWMVLDGLHVFTEVNDMIVDVLGEETKVSILQFVELKRVVSLSTMIAIVDVVLLTALSTIAAFIYNVVAALVGGVHVTLTDE